MRLFIGFSTDRQSTIRVPEGFFEDLLPAINSMLEMKVTLFMLWRLARGGAGGPHPRMVSLTELEADERLRAVLAQCKGPRPFAEALREGLELAVARGTLLQVRVQEEQEYARKRAGRQKTGTGSGTDNDANSNNNNNGNGNGKAATDSKRQAQDEASIWFLLNTRENRLWLEGVSKGEVTLAGTPLVTGGPGPQSGREVLPVRVLVERPDIYALYEQNIGLLTPILAERLQDAQTRYPAEWIEEAFEEAVANNKRNWRYIERILERWAAEGKHSGQDRGRTERTLDPDKYTKGKYAFLFRPES